MKNYKKNYYQSLLKRTAKLLLTAMALSLSMSSYLYANTWVDCGSEDETCDIENYASANFTTRYGVDGTYTYRYNQQGTTLTCGLSTFAEDPAPGQVKRCSYSLNSPKRSTSINVLHSLMADEYDHNDHDQVVAHMLSERESLYSKDRQHRLKLNQQGKIQLQSLIDSKWTKRWSKGNSGNTGSSSDMYQFYVTPRGLAIRKNGSIDWVLYDSNTLGEDRNYILYLTNKGVLNLVDMDDTKFSIRISAGGKSSAPRTSVSEAAIESLWNRAGWDHTDDWVASDHTNFRYLRRGLSHWHAHTVFEDMNEISEHYNSAPTDMWNEIKTVFHDIKDDPLGVQGVKNIINDGKNAKEVHELVKDLSKIVENMFDETLPIEEKLQYLLLKTFEEDIIGLANEDLLPDVLGHLSDTIEETNDNLGRRLQEDTTKADCKSLCRKLTRTQSKGSRVDYAMEVTPTFVGKALDKIGGFEANTLNQIQFRVFLTHPIIDGKGTRSMQLRLRMMDASGFMIDNSFETNYGAGSVVPVGIGLTIRDIVIPFSWKRGETPANAKILQPRYQSFGGIAAELDVSFTQPETEHDVQTPHQVSDHLADNLQESTGITIAGVHITDIVDVDNLAVDTTNAEAILEEARTTPNRYNSRVNFTVEPGAGVGITSVYNLNKMAVIGEGNSLNSARIEFGKVAIVQSLGSAAFVGIGLYTKMFTVSPEAATDWRASITGANLAFMAGSLTGDILYNAFHRVVHGVTDAVEISTDAFAWIAGRANWGSYLSTSAETGFGTYFGVSTTTPIRFRFQYNWAWSTRNDFTSIIGGKPDVRRLHEYGHYQLRTKHGKCLGLKADLEGVVQLSCSNLQRLTLQANLTGEAEFYEIRNMFDGKCVGIPDNAYGADGIVGSHVHLKSLACDTVEDARAVRWNANYIGLGNKLMLQSALDPTVCMDLSTGSDNDNTPFHTYTCNRLQFNQHFDMIQRTGVRDKSSGHTIRMKGDFCVDNEANSNDPSKETAFNVQRCLSHGINRQNFKFTPKGKGYFQINILGSNKYIDVSDASTDNNHIVHAWTSNSDQNQQWKPIHTSNGSVLLKARHSGKCLALSKHGATAGKLVQNVCKRNNIQQQFYISNERFGAYDGYNTNPDKPDSFGPSNKNPEPGKVDIIRTKQINTHQNDVDNKGPQKAVDGNTSGDPSAFSTATTHAASNTWWQADMESITPVKHVTVYNTTGGGAYRLRQFYILVTNTDVEGMTLAQARNVAVHEVYVADQIPGEVNNNSERFDLGGVSGRYLVIYKAGMSHLHLAEVVIEGPPRFVAAKQIDIHQDDEVKKGPLKAIDGNTSGRPAAYSTAITYAASNTWWQGDMGSETELDGVTLYNTTGGGAYRLKKFYILVTNTDVQGMTLAQARNAAVHEVYVADQVPGLANNNSERFDLGGAKGRYLVIYKESVSHLHLAEVVPD